MHLLSVMVYPSWLDCRLDLAAVSLTPAWD
jgi:hypothetical protein